MWEVKVQGQSGYNLGHRLCQEKRRREREGTGGEMGGQKTEEGRRNQSPAHSTGEL